ncbi:alpha/beta fold hydrolase [Bacillus sp. V5-8f]|uniref:alpha/beta fold hydrolase n=1 Tax=Bacillus sp. V5-8f TaxID=2053044 RepID=UPI000C76F30B|nr:alpha/beta hydrolase [Bacillus sp. V5-8f]PLT33276.1 alpha/beta hydrolase [Bacillus sp. V5-8f]
MTKTRRTESGMPYFHFGSGEPLLLIHGLGEFKEGWVHQFELSDEFELIIPDLRGHGEYAKTEGISIQSFASDLIGLLKELSLDSAHILGFSMGGAVAQEMYRQAPDKCRSLLLINTFHYFPKKLAKMFLKSRESKIESLTVEPRYEEAAKLSLYSWKEENIRDFSNFYQPNRDAFLASMNACLHVNNLSLLPNVQIPTLIIGGQYDSVLPVSLQLWMHKLMPDSEFIIMRNTGHMPKYEAKDRFNRLIRNFLRKQKASTRRKRFNASA